MEFQVLHRLGWYLHLTPNIHQVHRELTKGAAMDSATEITMHFEHGRLVEVLINGEKLPSLKTFSVEGRAGEPAICHATFFVGSMFPER